jgi:hypothetical protein
MWEAGQGGSFVRIICCVMKGVWRCRLPSRAKFRAELQPIRGPGSLVKVRGRGRAKYSFMWLQLGSLFGPLQQIRIVFDPSKLNIPFLT